MEKTEEKIPCWKCLLEGIENPLFDPEKTEEGWVQRCDRGHKLYVHFHLYMERNLIVDLLNKKVLYAQPGASKN